MPLFSKWIRVVNESSQEIMINTFKSEILALTEPESAVESTDELDFAEYYPSDRLQLRGDDR